MPESPRRRGPNEDHDPAEQQIAKLTAELVEERARIDRYETFLKGLQEGVIIQDADSNIIRANKSAARVLGLTMDQLLGRDSFDERWGLIDPKGDPLPPDMQPSMQALRTGKAIQGFILGVSMPDGARHWLTVNSQPFFREGETEAFMTTTTFVDITEKREWELELIRKTEELAKSAKEAQAASAAKTAFLANMSHELRTPLNGIVGVASVLSQTDLDDRQREMVDLIRTSGTALGKLLDDTMDLSRIEAERLEITPSRFDLKSEMQAATDLFRIAANEKSLDYLVELERMCCNQVVGDAIRIRQIVSNLIANAIKFSDAGKVHIRIRLATSEDDSDRCELIVLVADTGLGFSRKDKAVMFNRFQQGDKSISRRHQGIGLGLSISRGLAEAMGGNIHAWSRPGQGSVFRVSLPLQTVQQNDLTEDTVTLSELTPTSPTRVLVAEDHPANQRMLQIILEAAECQNELVSNGADAVSMFQTGAFDCIILDMHMPGMDGIEAARRIRESDPASATPIILLTADTSGQGVKAAAEAGVDILLHKPITAQGLLTAIQSTLGDMEQPGH